MFFNWWWTESLKLGFWIQKSLQKISNVIWTKCRLKCNLETRIFKHVYHIKITLQGHTRLHVNHTNHSKPLAKPRETTRNYAKLREATPNYSKLRKTMQNHAKLRKTTRNHAKPRETTRNHAKPRETTRNHTKLRKTMRNHSKLYATMPNHA